MNQSYPVPPPELVEQWRATPEYTDLSEKLFLVTFTTKKLQNIATQAAQWGADQELEACREWLNKQRWEALAIHLRAARRPKPPTLKEQAQVELDRLVALISTERALAMAEPIRRALEALDD